MSGVDVLFHQAAIRITQCAEEPRLALEVLVDGTFNVVEAAARRRCAQGGRGVLGLGLRPGRPVPDHRAQHPYANRTLYGAAKAFNEGLLRSFNDMADLDYVALRYFNVYGPRMDIFGVYTEVLVRWMERIAAGQPPLILGDGQQTMDFVYVDDVAGGQHRRRGGAGDRRGVQRRLGGRDQPAGPGRRPAAGHGLRPRARVGPERKVNPVSRRLADTAAARDKLGFVAEVDLDEGLRRLVDWWQAERRAERGEERRDGRREPRAHP